MALEKQCFNPELGEMIGDGTADDSPSDNDDLRALGQLAHDFSISSNAT